MTYSTKIKLKAIELNSKQGGIQARFTKVFVHLPMILTILGVDISLSVSRKKMVLLRGL